ncbi:MAG: transglycosylase SLT domain-containing protein [Halothiobacillaceae bacterium]
MPPFFILFALTLFLAPLAAVASADDSVDDPRPRQLLIENVPWTGDFDAMIDRRMIRVLVPYSRTLYFNDHGRERGLSAELVRDFEQFVNRALGTNRHPVTVYILPTTRDQLLPSLAQGLGDVAVGYLTVTEPRLEIVDFVAPDTTHTLDEVLVTGPSSPRVSVIEDLAGKTVHVRPATSYHESLQKLNASFVQLGLAPVRLVELPDPLEDEDLLEMLDAGLLELIFVDDEIAETWSRILDHIQLHPHIAIREDAPIGWAVRKDSPELVAMLERFYREYVGKQHVHRVRLARFKKQIPRLHGATRAEEYERFQALLTLFERYGEKYDFEPLMLAAQGYQESRLRQDAVSPVGAIGIMQLMPETGAEMQVGDIRVTENNIHAGAKYLDWLIEHFFSDAAFDDNNRMLFAFAAYNAGPGTIRRMRRLAEQEGLDPNRWFNHVERITGERFSGETTHYVRNIYKYFVAYQLERAQRRQREELLESIAAP